VAAFGVVLLVVLGLAACALVLVALRVLRDAPQDSPSADELAQARRRADVLAFREAELSELRSQGPLIDGELLAHLRRIGSPARPAQPSGEVLDSA